MKNQLFDYPLSSIPTFEEDDVSRVCIVSVIGKSDIGNYSCKAIPIDDLLKQNIFQGKYGTLPPLNNEILCNISAFYDEKGHVVYLHLIGAHDASSLLPMYKIFKERLEEKGFLDIWCEINVSYVQAMFFLFLVSHIVIIASPRPIFDTSYLQIFKTLDSMRQRFHQDISNVLKDVSKISSDWIEGGRPCSPRLLFVFMSHSLDVADSIEMADHSSYKPKKVQSTKKLEHALEDQIYKLLRKCRIITNISTNCLFAIPANQEFVHIYQSKNIITDPVTFLINQLRNHCQLSLDSQAPNIVNAPNIAIPKADNNNRTFSYFLKQHIDLALDKGFDDNVGRNCDTAYFSLPYAQVWFKASSNLFNHIFYEQCDNEDDSLRSYLKSSLDVDVKFSEARCKKVLPVATITYQENLPQLYTTEYHQQKLALTMKIFSKHARGPAFSHYAQKLVAECDKFWRSGHQLCETLSLTGNNCSNPLHKVSEKDQGDPSLPIMDHVSVIKVIAACNCGRTQVPREDPFNIVAANYDFYHKLESECCHKSPDKFQFPVFQPSSFDPREASIEKPTSLPDGSVDEVCALSFPQLTDDNQQVAMSHAQTVEEVSLSADNVAQKSSSQIESASKSSDNQLSATLFAENANYDVNDEKMLVRQPSTTEYLPGMLNSFSPSGLLPLYSYWSLICIGPSSLYSHNIGIHDQPGFIPGTNYLLPWDVPVKISSKDKEIRWGDLRRNVGRGKGKSLKDFTEVNVKVFIGLEYECPRGHRFMCASPEKVLKASGSGIVKENATKLISSDMPLYCNCPCRSNLQSVGQLMRIHIVTPKTPVDVLLNPRIQPGSTNSPVFFPGNSAPIKLTQSAYWVLRLPFIYQGDEGSYAPPKELQQNVSYGRLFKGVCSVIESTDIK